MHSKRSSVAACAASSAASSRLPASSRSDAPCRRTKEQRDLVTGMMEMAAVLCKCFYAIRIPGAVALDCHLALEVVLHVQQPLRVLQHCATQRLPGRLQASCCGGGSLNGSTSGSISRLRRRCGQRRRGPHDALQAGDRSVAHRLRAVQQPV